MCMSALDVCESLILRRVSPVCPAQARATAYPTCRWTHVPFFVRAVRAVRERFGLTGLGGGRDIGVGVVVVESVYFGGEVG